MFTSRWIRWALFRHLVQWAPGLARTFNFPLHATFASDVADEVLEDAEEDLAFAAEDLERAKAVLLPAMSNDLGDTSTYPSGRSRLRSLLLRIHHVTILGPKLSLVDKTGVTRLGTLCRFLQLERLQAQAFETKNGASGSPFRSHLQWPFLPFLRQRHHPPADVPAPPGSDHGHSAYRHAAGFSALRS